MKRAIILVGFLLISIVFMASASAKYSQTISQNQCEGVFPITNHANDTTFLFTQTPLPMGDGIITVSVKGDYGDGSDEQIEVIVDGTSIGTWSPYAECLCGFTTKTFTVTRNQLLQWYSDGKIEVKLIQGYDVQCFCTPGYFCHPSCDGKACENKNMVTLEYEGANNSLPMQQFMKILGLGQKD